MFVIIIFIYSSMFSDGIWNKEVLLEFIPFY